ncbi:hypothetical protein Tco_0572612 [Tanacetum coccineum]
MDSDKYLEGQSMQRPPLFESDSFIYWKNRFETYVKSKDLDLWHVITNGNSQVKDNKIDLLVQQYEQFVISEDKSIDSAFARFNTIITSLKPLDEAIEELKDLTSLSLDELIGNLKVHKMIIKKDYEIVKAKVKRKSIALKAKKNLVMKSVRLPVAKTKSTPWRCGDPNHLIGECPKPSKDKNQRAFVGGSWSDSGEEDDEKVKDETCLVAHASSEICLRVDLEPENDQGISGCAKL